LKSLLGRGIIAVAETGFEFQVFLLFHDVFVGSIDNHRCKQLVKICTELCRRLSDGQLVLNQDAAPQLRVAQSSLLAELSVNAVVQNHQLYLTLCVLPHEQIAWVGVRVNKALLEDHVIEGD
jgi:hypothetical protein